MWEEGENITLGVGCMWDSLAVICHIPAVVRWDMCVCVWGEGGWQDRNALFIYFEVHILFCFVCLFLVLDSL